MVYIWLTVALVFIILEKAKPGLFVFLPLFCGALAAALANIALPDECNIAQGVIFVIVSSIAFCVLRYALRKEDKDAPKDSVYALQGQRGVVIQEIGKYRVGAVKVGSEVWSAKTVHNETVLVGSTVEVLRTQGSHLIVVEVAAE